MDKRVLVTGGSGFIGANLVRILLEEGYHVKALVRPFNPSLNLQDLPVEIVYGDLHSPELTEYMRGCKAVFHGAALYSLQRSDRKKLMHVNVGGTRQVLKAARQAGVERVVYTSSVAAIGVRRDEQPANETYQSSIDQLIGQYKKSKYLAEQVVQEAVRQGQDVVLVNPTTPIGPWDRKPTPTGEIIVRFLRRQMPFYVDTGLNLIHVRDVALGHLLALNKGRSGERYILGYENLAFPKILSLLSDITGIPAPQYAIPPWIPLVVAGVEEYLLAPLGKKPSVTIDGVCMSTQKMYFNSDRAVKELGLSQTPIEQALEDAVRWFRANP